MKEETKDLFKSAGIALTIMTLFCFTAVFVFTVIDYITAKPVECKDASIQSWKDIEGPKVAEQLQTLELKEQK